MANFRYLKTVLGEQIHLTWFGYTGKVGGNYMETELYTIKLKLSESYNELQWEVEGAKGNCESIQWWRNHTMGKFIT